MVFQALRQKRVCGQTQYTDAIHLKASAHKNQPVKVQAKASRQDDLTRLDQAVEEARLLHGKQPLATPLRPPKVREMKPSTPEPDAGDLVRDGKPKGCFYLDHRTVDGKANMMTDVPVTLG